ncbi:Asp-tRNA(Asn)/Glu-tRNA(Gln) amidotransferase subunit GatA [Thermodesulforhabdus norvegica]|uniref:Glutamyl-tRNA(Gln) amidotransferase subunit A n=1 Tax=Thermodesulforhabdus norvegica TaxID=39841 RepID=A0A1I4VR39_9BACT|nr:Asp-tRNA(Asn)/Glu-tRNA(Gln) amidotransferase subunit GatA [Thermodesulforhabdus norvegica]SFN03734.1 aspartyl/glutamyl-tRNA(Asn/Gln) amidotransferase subunit A [Thermodesulforhabdus norvegica]
MSRGSGSVLRWDIHELRRHILKGEVTATEVVKASLERIREMNGLLNAFITVLEESSIEEAEKLDKNPELLKKLPLGGVPVAVKDCLCTQKVRTTCGSKILENFCPPFNATCVSRLREAGAVIVGKTNMDEFAMGSSTEHSAYGPSRNPWDTDRVPGGSSGGSAVAVASGMVPAALGTDTGGSIRLPAAFCGVVGLKPTYGRVSRYGLIEFASSFDQAGPITRTAKDAALMLQIIAGHDPLDSTSVPEPVHSYVDLLEQSPFPCRVGIPREYFSYEINGEISGAIEKAMDVLKKLGAEFVDVSLPHTDYGVAAYYIIAPAEASSNLARYDGVKYGFRAQTDFPDLMEMYLKTRAVGFGKEVKRRIMLGTYVLSAGYYEAYYGKASQVRRLIQQDFLKAFEQCDVLFTPVSPTLPFRIGEKVDNPLAMYLTDVFTLPASLAGIPGISVPCSMSSGGLPIAFQLLAPYFREDLLLRMAHAYQKETGGLPLPLD